MDAISESQELTLGRIFWLWVPLALMWLMLTVESPVINVGIARLPEARLNLAAFGLAFSIALILQSPVLALLSATTALADGLRAYKRLLAFTHLMVGVLTGVHLLVAFTPLYGVFARRVMGVPMEIALASRPAFMLLTPFAGAIAYRRIYQGLLIRYERNILIPITTATRLIVTVAFLLAGAAAGGISGAVLGAFAISMGALTGALTAFALAKPIVKGPIGSAPGSRIAWRDLLAFYVPLAMTTFLLLSLRAIMSAGLARTPNPDNALALWPVVYSVLIMFGSSATAYQEVVISQLRGPADRSALMRFARILAGILFLGFLLLAVTPLRLLWLRDISRLPADLLSASAAPLIILSPVPAILSFVSVYRGELIQDGRTRFITHATGINLAIITVLLIVVVPRVPIGGVTAASGAYVIALSCEMIYLQLRVRRATHPVEGIGDPQ